MLTGQPLLSPVGAVSDASLSTVQALVETCCYRVDEPEVAHAMETLRSYITMNDVSVNVSPATSSNAVLDIRTASLNACNTSSAEMTDSSTAVLKRETIQSQLSL
uniref:Uncharacterized protein n=1 Tax=Parascaris equorum TaxID=6256 RepID=A0A914RUK9_PAREQ